MISNCACTTASASSGDEDDCWRLAEANNNSTALPAYNASSQTWTLHGRHAAPGEYIGGDIGVDIGVAGPVYGAIKAGNLFSTSGNADVYGYVTGLAQRTTWKVPFRPRARSDVAA